MVMLKYSPFLSICVSIFQLPLELGPNAITSNGEVRTASKIASFSHATFLASSRVMSSLMTFLTSTLLILFTYCSRWLELMFVDLGKENVVRDLRMGKKSYTYYPANQIKLSFQTSFCIWQSRGLVQGLRPRQRHWRKHYWGKLLSATLREPHTS